MTTAQGLTRPQTRGRVERQERQRLRAPFALRCAPLRRRRTGGGGARTAGSSAETVGVLVALVWAVLNLGLFPGLTGMTLGKWATGLRIEKTDGSRLGIGRALLRHFVGYPLSFIVLGMGFIVTALTVRGRGLHDIIAGTIVVRESSF